MLLSNEVAVWLRTQKEVKSEKCVMVIDKYLLLRRSN